MRGYCPESPSPLAQRSDNVASVPFFSIPEQISEGGWRSGVRLRGILPRRCNLPHAAEDGRDDIAPMSRHYDDIAERRAATLATPGRIDDVDHHARGVIACAALHG